MFRIEEWIVEWEKQRYWLPFSGYLVYKGVHSLWSVSLAGALDDIRAGRIARGSTIVCTLTGHGLKDPDLAIARMQGPVVRVAAERLAVEQALMPHLG